VDDWYPPLDERAPGQVVLFNGEQPKEMTVLQVGDRVVGTSGGDVRVTLKVLEIPGSLIHFELEALEPDLPAYREYWSDGDTWWIGPEYIHEVWR